MKRIIGLAVVLLLTIGGVVHAGPNAGGVLLLHANPILSFTIDGEYCGQSSLSRCEDALTTVPGNTPTIFFVLAAFPTGSQPRLNGLAFGIDYPQSGLDIDGFGSCAEFSVAMDNWPATGTGVGLGFASVRTDRLVEVYWFAAHLAQQGLPALFTLTPHPTQGGSFGDDHVPARLDPIEAYGSLGFGQPGFVVCPSPLPQIGACCFADGSCVRLSGSDCGAQGGTYGGDYTPCTPNPCPTPGACCFASGECQPLYDQQCAQQGGTFLAGLDCDPNPCPLPFGACCFPDGACVLTTQQICEQNGGNYRGDFSACSPNPCPQPNQVACCFEAGTCLLLIPTECVAQGGSENGDYCAPNPCPQPPTGACCLVDGRCVILRPGLCAQQGTYFGDGSSCSPSPCPPGACCFDNGTCQMLDRDSCVGQSGQFLGVGSTCEANSCPSAGACCFPTGECRFLVPVACAQQNGAYFGDGLACDPNPCPQPCGALRQVNRENAPAAKPGASWSGVATSSGPNYGTLIVHTNPSIAYTDDGAGYCGQSGLASCETAITRHDGADPAVLFVLAAFHGLTQPRLTGVTFGIDYGECVIIDSWGSCGDFELATSEWPAAGEGTAVTWNVAQESRLTEVYWFGAYAYQGRIDTLHLTGHPTQGGYFADDSTPAILDPIRNYGVFGFNTQGYALCPGNGALTGACCFSNGECHITMQDDCFGVFQGSGTICDPNPCTSPAAGACCLGTYCVVISPTYCLSNEGVYQGDGTTCDPNPCLGPTAIERSTWGRIKARYGK